MTNTNKAIAEILVSEGYSFINEDEPNEPVYWEGEGKYFTALAGMPEDIVQIAPFSDTLDGRIQLDVLEKYFRIETECGGCGWYAQALGKPKLHGIDEDEPREARIACIKLCLEHRAGE